MAPRTKRAAADLVAAAARFVVNCVAWAGPECRPRPNIVRQTAGPVGRRTLLGGGTGVRPHAGLDGRVAR